MMFKTLIRRVAVASGAALLLIGLALPATGGPAMAQGLPPRPTVAPPAPTAAPSRDDDGDDERPTEPGRITGTVIDTRTGAPAPGLAVRVGEALVYSDSNGNYDLNGLAAGSYRVALELGVGQGAPAQGPVSVDLQAGQTVVQHLFYRSPEPIAPTVAPAPVPPSMPDVPFSAAPPSSAAPPGSLPDTSGRGDGQLPLLICGVALIVAGLGLRRRA